MRRSAIALRHVAFEDLGLLAPVLAREGWDVTFRDAAVDDLPDRSSDDAGLLIVLGGPIGVYDNDAYPFLNAEIDLIEYRLSRHLPVLGICLGAQLMAKALGSRVYAGPVKEIGWGGIELTAEGAASCLGPLQQDGEVVLHWHGDTFDLPGGAQRLASNRHYENQAFAHGRTALALQFHLEADPRRLEHWYVGHAAELAAAKVPVAELRAATSKIASGRAALADRVFTRWLREIAPPIESFQPRVRA
jgi:GMP synthase (glutamine-hydrolysing)